MSENWHDFSYPADENKSQASKEEGIVENLRSIIRDMSMEKERLAQVIFFLREERDKLKALLGSK